MSKFNLRRLRRSGTSAVITDERPSAATHEGAPGYARDVRSELFLLAVTSFVAEGTFYETAVDRDARLRGLVARVAVEDGDWTLRLVRWLRTGVHLRSVALVVAAEAVHARLGAGIEGGNRAIVDAALDRADEPGEFLAYWAERYGRASRSRSSAVWLTLWSGCTRSARWSSTTARRVASGSPMSWS